VGEDLEGRGAQGDAQAERRRGDAEEGEGGGCEEPVRADPLARAAAPREGERGGGQGKTESERNAAGGLPERLHQQELKSVTWATDGLAMAY